MRREAKPWTVHELRKLEQLKREERSWAVIVAQLPGRTYMAVVNRWHDLCRRSGARAIGLTTGRDARLQRHAAIVAAADAAITRPPRDLTAQLMGDPPPGRSALDRRAPRESASVTLAGGSS